MKKVNSTYIYTYISSQLFSYFYLDKETFRFLSSKTCFLGVYFDETTAAVVTSRLQIDFMHFGDVIIRNKFKLGPDSRHTINQSYWFWVY